VLTEALPLTSVWQYGGAMNIFSTFCSLFGSGSGLDVFQIPPHRQAVNVIGNCTATPCDPIAIGFKLPHILSLKKYFSKKICETR